MNQINVKNINEPSTEKFTVTSTLVDKKTATAYSLENYLFTNVSY